jgi:nucleotide-binding universal stress UspA family protein
MKLLVAMDDSEFARKALEKAMKLAHLEPSEIAVINVVPQLGAVDELPPRLAEKIKRSGKNILKEAEKTVIKDGIKVEVVLEEGVSPAQNIVSYAEENKIDLICIGHRGKSNLEKFFLGSVAMRVASHSPCSVMIVK